ncbi:MAG: starch-binding protein [Muribaculaceae bacterium]|nr:starch-binding protein [Muribaculaceae bacterium]
MHQLYKWAAAGLLAMSAAAPMSMYGQYVKGPDFSTFADRTDFRDESIYFAITTRFYDGDPMNNVLSWDGQEDQIKNNDPVWRGDFAGLIKKLDYIKALGFTAIWITPIVQNASGFDYHGYHSMDFSSVDLRYESRKEWGCADDVDFKDLIDAAHAKGIKIVLDIVLQHTGNFGENFFCKLFERDQNIKNQADITACLIPDEEKLGGQSYWDLPNDGAKTQYSERFKYMKNTDGQNHESNNYWHHVGGGWNWDETNRWWGQIAGDCVDLNTENPAVVDYMVKCYETFMAMGVDAFRIDTTGHIAPLTFNSAFIPKFVELGEKYKKQRLDEMPFYMFGECCARYGQVIYRDQHLLSSHYYTWQSDPSLVTKWKSYDADWWASQSLLEGAAPVGNMLTCESDPGTVHNSDNVFMKNGAWHEPDYSQASGFNVIDFPMHYNYNSAGDAVRVAKEGDHFYNDASWNVVYVDSHDYAPQPNDDKRFAGGTQQWAENLSMMFTFRGIPCLYYGSEVEFQKGATIDKGPLLALKESGRAYYGAYLEGDITADGFGKIKNASGNVKETLNGDLAQHIRRLNMIRQAVPALRKGQYTWDGCSANGGFAFKRAYKNSYALVAVNGGATFSNVPAGTYTDLVTGQTYQGGGSITVDAPKTQGQLRVLVKDWTGGKVGEDGKFIYASSPVAHGGNPSFTDPGTTQYYTKEDAVGPSIASVSFSPNGGTFKTETQNVTVTLSDAAVAGYYQVAGKERVNLSASNRTSTFTIGEGMNFGETVTVTWSATNDEGKENTGSVTYKKVDPNAAITIYVKGQGNIYAWGDQDGVKQQPLGAWPGKAINSGELVGEFYSFTFDGFDSINVIFNNGGNQTGDITGIDSDVYYEYDGNATANKVEGNVTPQASVTLSPNGGKFTTETITVTATAKNAVSAWYKIGNGEEQNFTSTAQFTIGEGMESGDQVTVSWGATNSEGTEKTGSATFTKQIQGQGGDDPIEGYVAYFVNSGNWSSVNAYAWSGNTEYLGPWPGKQLSQSNINGTDYYVVELEEAPENIIFNCGDTKTDDLEFVNAGIYNANGYTGQTMEGIVVVPEASVTFSPNGGKFTENTITVTATAKDAVSAWYKIGDGEQTSFTTTAQFTLGENMQDGDQVKVSWGATNSAGTEKTGSVTFIKQTQGLGGDEPVVGYVAYFINSGNWSRVNAYAWSGNTKYLGEWPGKQLSTTTIDGTTYYVVELETAPEKIIFNDGNAQTEDLDFVNRGIYNANGYTGQQIEGDDPIIVPPVIDPSESLVVYYDNTSSNWDAVNIHYWGGESASTWPGVAMQQCEHGHYFFSLPKGTTGVVFHNGNGAQTDDITPEHTGVYVCTGDKQSEKLGNHECSTSGVNVIEASQDDEVKIFNLQGVQVTNPGPGIYIVVRGKKVSKIRIN